MNKVSNFSLADWLNYLENRHQQEIQLGLSRIQTVAERLNLNELNAPVITIAGTNGKGSALAALEAIYLAAGYRVASYTSPHLFTFNERIRINRHPISDEYLCSAFTELEARRGSIYLTYFEMVTLAAFWYFKQFALDVIILEVGLGGRQDATNIIDADLAILTTVDLDHQDYLGTTRDAIGYEKAGIIRSNRPIIYADSDPPASVLDQIRLLDAKLHCFNRDYFFKTIEGHLNIYLQEEELALLSLPRINLKAAVAAIMASHCLQDWLPVTVKHWQHAMETVSIPGRQQVVQAVVTTIYDVAHNPQAVKSLVDLVQPYASRGRVHAVFSALKNKDLCGLIKPMRDWVDDWYPAMLNGKRAASKSALLAAFNTAIHLHPICFDDPLMAYQMAVQRASSGDLIIVYGSFLTVSAIIRSNGHEISTG